MSAIPSTGGGGGGSYAAPVTTFLASTNATQMREALGGVQLGRPARKTLYLNRLEGVLIACTSQSGTNATTLTCAAGANKPLMPGMHVVGVTANNFGTGTSASIVTVSAPSTTTITISPGATAASAVDVLFLPAADIGQPTGLSWSKSGSQNMPFRRENGLFDETYDHFGSGIKGGLCSWDDDVKNYVLKGTYNLTPKITDGASHRLLTNAAWTKIDVVATTATGCNGAANAGSQLACSVSGGGCYRDITSSGTYSFVLAMKRGTGTGRVWISAHMIGGDFKEVSQQISTSAWTLLSVQTSVTNPRIGIIMETPGDTVFVDIVNFVPSDFTSSTPLSYPSAIPFTDYVQGPLPSPTVNGRRYYVSCWVKVNGMTGSMYAGFGMRNNSVLGSATSTVGMNVAVLNSQICVTYSSKSGNVTQFSGNFPSKPVQLDTHLNHYGIEPAVVPLGKWVKMGFIMGRKAMQLFLNDRLIGTDEYGTNGANADCATMNYIGTYGEGFFRRLVCEELTSHNVVLLGHSMVASSAFSKELRHNSNPFDVQFINKGVGGDVIGATSGAGIRARVSTDVTPYYDSHAASNTVVIWPASNTIAAGTSGATALTQLQSLVTEILAGNSGWRIYLMEDLPSRTGALSVSAGTFTTEMNAYNAGLPAITGICGVIPTTSIPELADSTSANFSGDGVHPAAHATSAIAQLVLQRLSLYQKPPAQE